MDSNLITNGSFVTRSAYSAPYYVYKHVLKKRYKGSYKYVVFTHYITGDSGEMLAFELCLSLDVYRFLNAEDGITMADIVVYTTQTCPRCVRLKKVLEENNVSYREADMSTPESLTELRVNGVFTNEAPVLQIDETFLTGDDLFRGNDVNTDALVDIL